MVPDNRLPDPREIEAMFHELIEIQDVEIQQASLRERCVGKPELYAQVNRLLIAYARGKFLEVSAIDLTLNAGPAFVSSDHSVGQYKLLELMASGGMGEVYVAYNLTAPQDYVAVKLLAAEFDSRQSRLRFALEQTILKKLNHPCVVQLRQAGETAAGRPFFVMELIRGLPLDRFCNRAELTLDERIKLIIQVCQAMQYVHSQGVVHRDLKPANILVQSKDGNAQLKIIDFGVAKYLGERETIAASLTCAEQILGTPAYMSPEQLDWSTDVTPQSDIYSIGSLLCNLLIGTTPLDARLRPESLDCDSRPTGIVESLDIENLREILMSREPDRPSQILAAVPIGLAERVAKTRRTPLRLLRQRLSKQLDWIVLKALSPQKSDRYKCMADLAADLQAVLEDRPTMARPPSRFDRFKKWSNRNKDWIKNTIIYSLLLLGLLGMGLTEAARRLRVRQANSLAGEQQAVELELQQREFVADLRQAAVATLSGNNDAAEKLLKHYQAGQHASVFTSFALDYLTRIQVNPELLDVGHIDNLSDMDVSADGRWLATGDIGGEIRVNDVRQQSTANLAPVAILENLEKEVHRVRFSPDGKFLAATGQDQRVRVWQTGSWEQYAVLACANSTLNSLAWSPDSQFLLGGDRQGRLFAWEIDSIQREIEPPKLKGPLRAMAWSPDGQTVAIAEDDQVGLWDPVSWTCRGRVSLGSGVLSLAFSPDSATLAIGGYSADTLLVNVTSGTTQQKLIYPMGDVVSIAFHGNNGLFLGDSSGHVSYFHRISRNAHWGITRVSSVGDARSKVVRVLPSTDNQSLWFALQRERRISNTMCHQMIGFESIPKPSSSGERPETAPLMSLDRFAADPDCRPAFHSDTQTIAMAGRDDLGHCILLWRRSDGQLIDRLQAPSRVRQLCFSPNGQQLVVCGPDPLVSTHENSRAATFLYNRDTQDFRRIEWPYDGSECRCSFVESGNQLVLVALRQIKIASIDCATTEVLKTRALSTNAVSLQSLCLGQQVLIVQTDRLTCLSSDLNRELWSVPTPQMVSSIVDCQDDRTLAGLCIDGRIRLWDTQTHEMLYELPCDGPGFRKDIDRFWLECPNSGTLILDGFELAEAIRFGGSDRLSESSYPTYIDQPPKPKE